jgi:hypothetical protein
LTDRAQFRVGDRLDESLLRALLRVALLSAGGDRATALRLAVDRAGREPDLTAALEACLATERWGRLVREELVQRR